MQVEELDIFSLTLLVKQLVVVPKGRVPCTIFTKITGYMRVLSHYNAAESGCFISINDKIINNLLRCGRFQPNLYSKRKYAEITLSQNVVVGFKLIKSR